jgi:hypothetical protein
MIPAGAAMTEFCDIDVEPDSVCLWCKQPMPAPSPYKSQGARSPWSVCFDPSYRENVWGGDTHEIKGYLCQDCAETLLL